MIQHENLYYKFIQEQGVGSNDIVASSPDSYISYLRSVSKLINEDISPSLLRNELDIINIENMLKGKRAAKTVKNYCSAMRQYVKFVRVKGFWFLSRICG